MKKKATDQQMLLEAMLRMQEEKAQLSLLLGSLRDENRELKEGYAAEMGALREAHAEDMEKLRASHAEELAGLRESLEQTYKAQISSLQDTLETMRRTMKDMQEKMGQMERLNADQFAQLQDAMAGGRLSRGKRFGRSSEQKDLLNNRNTDRRAEEKDDFDGTPPAAGCQTPESETSAPSKTRKKKSAGRKPSKEEYACDEVVLHSLEEYFKLGEGASLKTRRGEVEMHSYSYLELIPARIIKHVFETAVSIEADGEAHATLPAEERKNAVKGCPFTPGLLAFIMTEKYCYHTPKNQIRKKLRDMGLSLSKSTFVHYFQVGEKALRDLLEPTLKAATLETSYLMVDETCELVGVIDDETKIPEYRKRYLWAFFNKEHRLVSYIYEDGSRGREVLTGFLKGFSGAFTSDGYSAYKIYDREDGPPGVTRCGCWTHVRRKFIEALGVARDICWNFIDEIGTLFAHERSFVDLDPLERRERRRKQSLPVLNRIFSMAKRVADDATLMGRDLLGKAVRYLRNEEQALRNFITQGRAEISNNLCEQLMKPVKLCCKTSQNIGSEAAAKNDAFMHSLMTSASLNKVSPMKYLTDLFGKIGEALSDQAKRALLPDQWVAKCVNVPKSVPHSFKP